MNADIVQALEAIRRCRALRDRGVSEAVLRGEFQSRLRCIFPEVEDERWINHYNEGAETHTRIGVVSGVELSRFIDNLVGATAIEYEADLRMVAKYNEGFRQAKEHVLGLLRDGVPSSQVRGVLSDTVDWYAYDVVLDSTVDPDACFADDIELVEVDKFHPATGKEADASHLVLFLRRHLAREQSRNLIAKNIAFDLGLESLAYKRNVGTLAKLVKTGRNDDPSVTLATDLWAHFVDHLEGEGGDFRINPYVDEVYLNIVARLLSANALAGVATISGDAELQAILNGSFFRDTYQIDNLVEKDYFGWIAKPKHVAGFLPVAHEIQRDLYVYDFGRRTDEGLFGQLMTQLARRSQREILGQEWTPSWLARHLAERCLNDLPAGETPEIIDMCCGSGTMLVEVIKAVKGRFGYDDITRLGNVVTGFDIDPLAVALAKTTWVITLASEIKSADNLVTIPIFHADSLFAATPVSASIPMLGESDMIDITLDDKTIQFPAGLLKSEFRELFDRLIDRLIDWAYDEAQQNGEASPTIEDARITLDAAAAASRVNAMLSEELKAASAETLLALALRMKELAIAGRNGIWAFILRNTYRPGLLVGQFNGLVSNPPWLAMSAIADNPYRKTLSQRAEIYGVCPSGQSFLHLELGTTYLLHAVDRYLKPGAVVACLVPGTILNGNHHEKFRQRGYLDSDRPVALSITEVWQVEHDTFNHPGIALIGKKEGNISTVNKPVASAAMAYRDRIVPIDFTEHNIDDTRTAWVFGTDEALTVVAGGRKMPRQGADIMPRNAVCIEILNSRGHECRVDSPRFGTEWGFTVKQAKVLKGERFPGYVAQQFIYRLAQSANLLPFVFGRHWVPIAIPACRDEQGVWQIYEPKDIRRMGFTRTARRFAKIDERLATIGDSTLADRIDLRRKLSVQNFGDNGFIVLSGAGGKDICAACLPVDQAANFVVDQTLYWQVVSNEADAWFRIGILNSTALTEAILPFNPEGSFGSRHIHSLPYRIMPSYDATKSDHQTIASIAQAVADEAGMIVESDAYIGDPNCLLHFRRRRLREKLAEKESFCELNHLCGAILDAARE